MLTTLESKNFKSYMPVVTYWYLRPLLQSFSNPRVLILHLWYRDVLILHTGATTGINSQFKGKHVFCLSYCSCILNSHLVVVEWLRLTSDNIDSTWRCFSTSLYTIRTYEAVIIWLIEEGALLVTFIYYSLKQSFFEYRISKSPKLIWNRRRWQAVTRRNVYGCCARFDLSMIPQNSGVSVQSTNTSRRSVDVNEFSTVEIIAEYFKIFLINFETKD